MATDRQIAAYTLSGFTIPALFVPTYSAPPVEPMSMFEKFGTVTNNPTYYDVYNEYYYPADNTWTTPDLLIAPTALRDDVAAWLIIVNGYEALYIAWKIGYDLAREVQWRFTLADLILL